VLGLPDGAEACLFDLDGVLTQTARVHAAAWKQAFDGYLHERAAHGDEVFVPFDVLRDYQEYVDGKPRDEGVRSFLSSRGIELPEGGPNDPADAATVHGLGNRKNEIVLRLIDSRRVTVYPGSLRYVRAIRAAGLATAVVSSSANCVAVLVAAGIEDLFAARIDGVVAARQHLPGKPAPDTFLAAARALGVAAKVCVVFEDSLAGVEAGRAGRFCYVVGVDRAQQADELRASGADVVVRDLSELIDQR